VVNSCVINFSLTEADARLLHSLSAGLAVVDPATGRTEGERSADAVEETAFAMVAKADLQ
jgi:hypothetical protein